MASLDSLPPDQRAVLQLVLQRGRSYDEIARMLSIDRAAVRERALQAFDALGPGTRAPAERRALITDYLLGQLPDMVAEDTRRRLGESAVERAWARVVASELGTLSSGPLPEIPVEAVGSAAEEPAPAPAPEAPTQAPAAAAAIGEAPPPRQRRTSRRGGAVVLAMWGVVLVAAIVVAVILIVNSGGSSTHTSSATASASTTTSPTTASSSPTTSTSTSASATPLARVILTSPAGNKKLNGAAVVVAESGKTGIVIRATGLPANTSHNAYAVWLSNSPTDSKLLGFVNPGVKSDGVLQAGSLLPSNVSHYKQLLITLETTAKPHTPGEAILKGPLNVPA